MFDKQKIIQVLKYIFILACISGFFYLMYFIFQNLSKSDVLKIKKKFSIPRPPIETDVLINFTPVDIYYNNNSLRWGNDLTYFTFRVLSNETGYASVYTERDGSIDVPNGIKFEKYSYLECTPLSSSNSFYLDKGITIFLKFKIIKTDSGKLNFIWYMNLGETYKESSSTNFIKIRIDSNGIGFIIRSHEYKSSWLGLFSSDKSYNKEEFKYYTKINEGDYKMCIIINPSNVYIYLNEIKKNYSRVTNDIASIKMENIQLCNYTDIFGLGGSQIVFNGIDSINNTKFENCSFVLQSFYLVNKNFTEDQVKLLFNQLEESNAISSFVFDKEYGLVKNLAESDQYKIIGSSNFPYSNNITFANSLVSEDSIYTINPVKNYTKEDYSMITILSNIRDIPFLGTHNSLSYLIKQCNYISYDTNNDIIEIIKIVLNYLNDINSLNFVNDSIIFNTILAVLKKIINIPNENLISIPYLDNTNDYEIVDDSLKRNINLLFTANISVQYINVLKNFIYSILISWSVTQEQNINQQLEDNIRYIDIKLKCEPYSENSVNIYLTNGIFKTTKTLEDFLKNDILTWVENKNQLNQIVILHFSEIYNFDIGIKYILDTIENTYIDTPTKRCYLKLIYRSFILKNVIVKECIKLGNIIIIVDDADDSFKDSYGWLLNKNDISYTNNIPTTDIFKSYISTYNTDKNLSDEKLIISNSYPRLFQNTLNINTAGDIIKTIVKGLTSNSINFPKNLKELSLQFTPSFMGSYNGESSSFPLKNKFNIMSVDYTNKYNLFNTMIENGKTLTTSLDKTQRYDILTTEIYPKKIISKLSSGQYLQIQRTPQNFLQFIFLAAIITQIAFVAIITRTSNIPTIPATTITGPPGPPTPQDNLTHLLVMDYNTIKVYDISNKKSYTIYDTTPIKNSNNTPLTSPLSHLEIEIDNGIAWCKIFNINGKKKNLLSGTYDIPDDLAFKIKHTIYLSFETDKISLKQLLIYIDKNGEEKTLENNLTGTENSQITFTNPSTVTKEEIDNVKKSYLLLKCNLQKFKQNEVIRPVINPFKEKLKVSLGTKTDLTFTSLKDIVIKESKYDRLVINQVFYRDTILISRDTNWKLWLNYKNSISILCVQDVSSKNIYTIDNTSINQDVRYLSLSSSGLEYYNKSDSMVKKIGPTSITSDSDGNLIYNAKIIQYMRIDNLGDLSLYDMNDDTVYTFTKTQSRDSLITPPTKLVTYSGDSIIQVQTSGQILLPSTPNTTINDYISDPKTNINSYSTIGEQKFSIELYKQSISYWLRILLYAGITIISRNTESVSRSIKEDFEYLTFEDINIGNINSNINSNKDKIKILVWFIKQSYLDIKNLTDDNILLILNNNIRDRFGPNNEYPKAVSILKNGNNIVAFVYKISSEKLLYSFVSNDYSNETISDVFKNLISKNSIQNITDNISLSSSKIDVTSLNTVNKITSLSPIFFPDQVTIQQGYISNISYDGSNTALGSETSGIEEILVCGHSTGGGIASQFIDSISQLNKFCVSSFLISPTPYKATYNFFDTQHCHITICNRFKNFSFKIDDDVFSFPGLIDPIYIPALPQNNFGNKYLLDTDFGGKVIDINLIHQIFNITSASNFTNITNGITSNNYTLENLYLSGYLNEEILLKIFENINKNSTLNFK